MSQTRELNSTPIPTANFALIPTLEFKTLTYFSFRELALVMVTSNAWRVMANAVRMELQNSPTTQHEFTAALLYFIQQRNYEKINYYLDLGLRYNVNFNAPYVGKTFEGEATRFDSRVCLFRDPSPLLLASNVLSYHKGAKVVQSLLYKSRLVLNLYSIPYEGGPTQLEHKDDSIFFSHDGEKLVIADKNQLIKFQTLNTPLLIRYNKKYFIYRFNSNGQSWQLFPIPYDAENISKFDDLHLPFKENEMTQDENIEFMHTKYHLLYQCSYVGIEDIPVAFITRKSSRNTTPPRKITPFQAVYDSQVYALLYLAQFESILINIRSLDRNHFTDIETQLFDSLIFELEQVDRLDSVLLRNYLTRLLTMDDWIPGITRPLTREDRDILNRHPDFKLLSDECTDPSFYKRNIEPYELNMTGVIFSTLFLAVIVKLLFMSLPAVSIFGIVVLKGMLGLTALVVIKSIGEFCRDLHLKNSPDLLHQDEDKKAEEKPSFRGGLFFKQPKAEISSNPQKQISQDLIPFHPNESSLSPKLN